MYTPAPLECTIEKFCDTSLGLIENWNARENLNTVQSARLGRSLLFQFTITTHEWRDNNIVGNNFSRNNHVCQARALRYEYHTRNKSNVSCLIQNVHGGSSGSSKIKRDIILLLLLCMRFTRWSVGRQSVRKRFRANTTIERSSRLAMGDVRKKDLPKNWPLLTIVFMHTTCIISCANRNLIVSESSWPRHVVINNTNSTSDQHGNDSVYQYVRPHVISVWYGYLHYTYLQRG